MKALLPLLAIALMLAGCTSENESGDDDANETTTGEQRGGEVSGEMTVTEGNGSTNSTPTNSTG